MPWILFALIVGLAIAPPIWDFPHAVKIPKGDSKLDEVVEALQILGRDPKYAQIILTTAEVAGVDPILWVCNIEQESRFIVDAVSHKGYKGLGQTPTAIMHPGYEFADLAHAACVYAEKVRITKGDKKSAWYLYKGGMNPEARRVTKLMLAMYAEVKAQIKEGRDE